MTRSPDALCTRCERPMWRKAGTTPPKLCRSCRTEDRGGVSLAEWRCKYTTRTVSIEEQQRRMIAGRNKIIDRTCDMCSASFRGTVMRRFCAECVRSKRRAVDRQKSAIRRSTNRGYRDRITGELITIAALGDRDSWTCWLCREFVNRDLRDCDPWMPSFDHVLPISRGGLDSWDNLRLAHLTCNVRRGNKVAA